VVVIVRIALCYHLSLSICQARPGLNVRKLTLTPPRTYFQSTNRRKHCFRQQAFMIFVSTLSRLLGKETHTCIGSTCNRQCGQSALREMLSLTCAPTCLQNHSHALFQMLAVGPLRSRTEWAEFVVDSFTSCSDVYLSPQ